MTVRWKPLIVLSGLFLVIAVLGLLAITFEMVPSRSSDIVALARAEWKAGRFSHAKIHFQRALQKDPKNPEIHAELAQLYAEWSERDAAMRVQLRAERLRALADAAKYGPQLEEPRRQLLEDSLRNEELGDRWAKELLDLNPADPDAHFAMAVDALDATPTAVSDAKTHLEALEAREPDRLRTEWIRARVAQVEGDQTRLNDVLTRIRSTAVAADTDAIDRMAFLRLRQLDALATTDPTALAERMNALGTVARDAVKDGIIPPDRLARLGRILEDVQRHLTRVAGGLDAARIAPAKAAGAALEEVAESSYKKALDTANAADLRVYQEYASYLLARQKRTACLELAAKALKQPVALLPVWSDTVAQLREIAIKAALSDAKDAQRYAQAEPHIKALSESASPRDQALAHLFRGVIELERSGLVDATRDAGTNAAIGDAKVRASALNHLKLAAEGLSEISTAQALYGVALLLSGEPGLGRQYLQIAQRMPNIEPQYQVWAAWAMVQSGYPEEAEPIVERLLDAMSQGKLGKDLEPTLRLLRGEIYQARRTPDDLRKARDEYQKAIAAGQPRTLPLELRLAQIDLLLGNREEGISKLEQLRTAGKGGAAAEHLAILALSDQNKMADARRRLAEARKRYPDSAELAALDAALHLREEHPEHADQVLSTFSAAHPKDLDVVQMRARVLAGPLKRPDDARKLLLRAAEGAETSAPLIQLALLDLSRRDDEAVARTIKTIRARWKESASADLLDAQLAMARNQPRAAASFIDAALKKDPANKIARFWRAQLDDRAGATAEAAKIYEEIAREKPVKELEDGLSLATAANWALATMALENQEVDDAIGRLEGLLRGDVTGELSRPLRWQLVAARDAKGQWPVARTEIAALLKDPKTTTIERVRAANFYRLHNETPAAATQLDLALKSEPGYSPAVALRAFLLAQSQPAQAGALLRKAIATTQQPPSIHLMLAAIENITPPTRDGMARASKVIDAGLKAHPDSVELLQAKYRVLRLQGDPKGALAFVLAQAKKDPKGQFRRFLVDIYRDEARYAEAERIVRELLKETPEDTQLAAMQIRLVVFQAIEAANRGDTQAEKASNAQTAQLIAQFRAQFPTDPTFLQAECELAARMGKMDRALEITNEIDAMDKNSPIGPLLRAQLASTQGWTQGMVKEYGEASSRAPRRADIRLALGQANLSAGKYDEALRQANWLLESDTNTPAALVLKARALARQPGTPAEVQARRTEAMNMLRALLPNQPKFAAAYHLIAEIQLLDNARAEAVATLKVGLKENPADAAGLSILVQILSEPRAQGQTAPPKDVQTAMALAEEFGGKPDSSPEIWQALAVGFHRAGQVELALPWAEKAAGKLDTWLVHLSFGDILMSKAEMTTVPGEARPLYERAVAQYDLVLKTQANSIEAINNKAWILHECLDRDPEALALVEGLMRRVDPVTLPAEFHDTLGAIQESMNRRRDAELSYQNGLRKAPEHPILNFHLGRLLANDPDRAGSAVDYLKKAQLGRAQLPPRFAAELETLLKKTAS
jgi:predicted Zn-dependent protease